MSKTGRLATETTQQNGKVHAVSDLYVPLRRPEVTTVVLCGHAPTSRELAPFNRPDVECWTMNDSQAWILFTAGPDGQPTLRYRMDRWFEIHEPEVYQHVARRSAGYLDFLQRFQGPIYMQEPNPQFPTAVRYPLEAICGLTKWAQPELQLGPFGSSFGWMIALAVLEGFTRIEMYGCDLAANEEYVRQRPSTFFWMGWCEGRGIDFVLPDATPLLSEHFYGFRHMVVPSMSRDEIMNHIAELRQGQSLFATKAMKAEARAEEATWWATRLGAHK